MTAPAASSPGVRSRMQKQSSRDTGPEMALRKELHRRGLRYRVHVKVLPRRTADIVFPRAKVAVFVDGCFWHGCPEHYKGPKQNGRWWGDKIERNRLRDGDTNTRLALDGWVVIRVRECTYSTEWAADWIGISVRCALEGEVLGARVTVLGPRGMVSDAR